MNNIFLKKGKNIIIINYIYYFKKFYINLTN